MHHKIKNGTLVSFHPPGFSTSTFNGLILKSHRLDSYSGLYYFIGWYPSLSHSLDLISLLEDEFEYYDLIYKDQVQIYINIYKSDNDNELADYLL